MAAQGPNGGSGRPVRGQRMSSLNPRQASVLATVEALRTASMNRLCHMLGSNPETMSYNLRALRDMGLVRCTFRGKFSLWSTPEDAHLCEAELNRLFSLSADKRKSAKVSRRNEQRRQRNEQALEQWANTVNRRIVPAATAGPLPHPLPAPAERLDFVLAGLV